MKLRKMLCFFLVNFFIFTNLGCSCSSQKIDKELLKMLRERKTVPFTKIKKQIDSGADMAFKDEQGGTPLYYAASHHPDLEVVKYIISKGGKINESDKEGFTPLLGALVSNSNPEVALYLIKNGADPNLATKDGDCPILYASMGIN
jgi:ankyrin repeat protein